MHRVIVRGGFWALAVTAVAVGLLIGPPATAWPTYHDPALEGDPSGDEGNCSSCHPGFLGGRSDVTHSLHTGNPDPVTTNCNLCHSGSGRNNPYTMWSVGDSPPDGFGCAGCHGRDYGETSAQSYDNGSGTINTAGAAKMSGYGLREHHRNNGVTTCFQTGCHTQVSQSFIEPENVAPAYYGRSDVSLGGSPADPCTNEDSGNDADSTGLDNDGDTLIDMADPDCSGTPAGPGEVSGATLAQMRVTAHDKVNGNITITYDNACSTTDNSLEHGDLALVSSYTYGGRVCNIGISGTYVWTYPAGSQFFLIVGDDTTIQGSYGTDGAGGERPPDASSCVPRDLTNRCD